MTSVGEDLVDLIVAGGLATKGGSSGWGAFIDKWPFDRSQAIVCVNTPGLPPDPKFARDNATVQILVRGAPGGDAAAEAKAFAIKNLLLGAATQTVNSNVLVGIWMSTDIYWLSTDEENRPVYGMNLRLVREPADGGNRT